MKKKFLCLFLVVALLFVCAIPIFAARNVYFTNGTGSLTQTGTMFYARTSAKPEVGKDGYTTYVRNAHITFIDYSGSTINYDLPDRSKAAGTAEASRGGVYTVKTGTYATHQIMCGSLSSAQSSW